jgi:tetraacyldisaccharide 4'-kinase
MSNQYPDLQFIILDDAYQHRAVNPDINLLLCDYSRPFYSDWVLPMGRLRESRAFAHRADAVIVSKCPSNLSISEKNQMITSIRAYTKAEIPIFFSQIRYLAPCPLFEKNQMIGENLMLLTGIARPEGLIKRLQNDFRIIHHFREADHAEYPIELVRKLAQEWKKFSKIYSDLSILMTEKDSVKLLTEEVRNEWKDIPVFYLPIEVDFIDTDHSFDHWFLEQIKGLF